MPEKTRVWRIQTLSTRPGEVTFGVVAHHFGFLDSPDAEILVPGFNNGKESGAMGIGRQGNLLQWGFSAPPSKMTEAGKAMFINCICYIRKFDGKKPLVRRENCSRDYEVFLASLIREVKDEDFRKRRGTPELLERYKENPAGLVGYYRQNLELIYQDGGCRVDEELPKLGIQSNRQLQTLEKLIACLRDPDKQVLAQKLLQRYTREPFTSAEQWESWFGHNKGRLFFTDCGGYKFMVVPEGYL